ncbi:hypothetical protein RM190_04955 [Paracoccus sp. CPCC 101403]|uniref:Uncharacterized protein n=1 Tax=Paracoccus broussonetiae TaxID=3075834 RepID=A0ABU3EAE5_9RHOB|nr:hypothetical protein [Paracoccus sp. CPCC 101403]MDT1061198.1 hypothetical protein [Paracoccus sp. CPCC 101403]
MVEIVIPDFVNTLARANQAAAQVNDVRQQNALAGYYRDNAQGLLAGDQNALAGLAQYDPQAAFGMQRQIQDDQQRAADRAEMRADRLDERNYQRGRDARMDARQSRADDRADERWRMELEQYAATKSQAEREAEAAAIEQAVQQGLSIPDAATWDAFMTQNGQPDLVGKFDQRESIARGYMSIAEQLKGMQPQEPADEYQRYVQEEQAAGRQPLGRIEYSQAKKGQGFSVTTPDGTTVAYGNQPGAKPLTEAQSKLALFQNMQDETSPVINNLETQWNPANMSDAAAARVPIAGNYWTSQEGQLYKTAAEAWAEGALRIQTGAAATDPEIQRVVRTYFAVPGDTPQTVAFKQQMRDMYARSIGAAQGKPTEPGLTVPEAAPAASPAQGAVPDFSAMSDEDLADWIAKNGG